MNSTLPNGDGVFHTLATAFPRLPQEGIKLPSEEQANALVDLLIELKGNPNDTNNLGETPLHVAARKDTHGVIITAMIKSGANPI